MKITDPRLNGRESPLFKPEGKTIPHQFFVAYIKDNYFEIENKS